MRFVRVQYLCFNVEGPQNCGIVIYILEVRNLRVKKKMMHSLLGHQYVPGKTDFSTYISFCSLYESVYDNHFD